MTLGRTTKRVRFLDTTGAHTNTFKSTTVIRDSNEGNHIFARKDFFKKEEFYKDLRNFLYVNFDENNDLSGFYDSSDIADLKLLQRVALKNFPKPLYRCVLKSTSTCCDRKEIKPFDEYYLDIEDRQSQPLSTIKNTLGQREAFGVAEQARQLYKFKARTCGGERTLGDRESPRKHRRSPTKRSRVSRTTPLFIDRLKRDFQRPDDFVPRVRAHRNWCPEFLSRYLGGDHRDDGQKHNAENRSSISRNFMPEKPKVYSMGLQCSSKLLDAERDVDIPTVDSAIHNLKERLNVFDGRYDQRRMSHITKNLFYGVSPRSSWHSSTYTPSVSSIPLYYRDYYPYRYHNLIVPDKLGTPRGESTKEKLNRTMECSTNYTRLSDSGLLPNYDRHRHRGKEFETEYQSYDRACDLSENMPESSARHCANTNKTKNNVINITIEIKEISDKGCRLEKKGRPCTCTKSVEVQTQTRKKSKSRKSRKREKVLDEETNLRRRAGEFISTEVIVESAKALVGNEHVNKNHKKTTRNVTKTVRNQSGIKSILSTTFCGTPKLDNLANPSAEKDAAVAKKIHVTETALLTDTLKTRDESSSQTNSICSAGDCKASVESPERELIKFPHLRNNSFCTVIERTSLESYEDVETVINCSTLEETNPVTKNAETEILEDIKRRIDKDFDSILYKTEEDIEDFFIPISNSSPLAGTNKRDREDCSHTVISDADYTNINDSKSVPVISATVVTPNAEEANEPVPLSNPISTQQVREHHHALNRKDSYESKYLFFRNFPSIDSITSEINVATPSENSKYAINEESKSRGGKNSISTPELDTVRKKSSTNVEKFIANTNDRKNVAETVGKDRFAKKSVRDDREAARENNYICASQARFANVDLEHSGSGTSRASKPFVESIDSGVLTDCSRSDCRTGGSFFGQVMDAENKERDDIFLKEIRKLPTCGSNSDSGSDDSLDRLVEKAVKKFTEDLIICERRTRTKLKAAKDARKKALSRGRTYFSQAEKTSLHCAKANRNLYNFYEFPKTSQWSSEDERTSLSTPSLSSFSDSEIENSRSNQRTKCCSNVFTCRRAR